MKKGISQEGLKILACVTMLIDHIGAAMFPRVMALRVIGRIAFPIYCFLLVEGSHYTKNPKKYAMRLGTGLLLSEIPFDMALFGGLTLHYQSVMVTLLLGFLMLRAVQHCTERWKQLLILGLTAVAAELLRTDYGAMGIFFIALFAYCRDIPFGLAIAGLGMAVLCIVQNPFELYALTALVPIWLYDGRKTSHSRAVQWGFYLFYPVHLTLIWLVTLLI